MTERMITDFPRERNILRQRQATRSVTTKDSTMIRQAKASLHVHIIYYINSFVIGPRELVEA
jgi:hypothetical protein